MSGLGETRISVNIALGIYFTPYSSEVYMRESERMVSRLGFWSEEFRKFRDWWQQNMDRASVDEVRRMAEKIRRDAGCR